MGASVTVGCELMVLTSCVRSAELVPLLESSLSCMFRELFEKLDSASV